MTQNAKPLSTMRTFLDGEALGGVLLIGSAVLALLLVNGGVGTAGWYHHFVHAPIGPVVSPALGEMTIHLWVNDGLMAVFFFVVGLEIKREFVDGRLASWRQRRLPMIAAAGGMVVPALIYLFVVRGQAAELARGWAIPAATDIAFALGILALLGSRAPTSLKLLLTTIAIVDDMGAVVIIALVYTTALNGTALAAAGGIWLVMMACNRAGVKTLVLYLLLAWALWYAVLLSGVHATIAGVLAAMTIPIRVTPGAPDADDSPLHRLEVMLHPWSAYLIVPLFGFVNAGVMLTGAGRTTQSGLLPLGIAAGLVLGKQLGIFASIWLCVRSGLGAMPRGATWAQVYGLALLCGIGFTMSLFIGALAFPARPDLVEQAKIGILGGSLVAALCGYAVLRFAPLHRDHVAIESVLAGEIDTDGDVAE